MSAAHRATVRALRESPLTANPFESRRIVYNSDQATRQVFLGEKLSSIFDSARAMRDITAWICFTDDVASHACAYLADKGISVPGDVSVVSIGNGLQAEASGITSWDMGYPRMAAAAHRLLHRLIRSPSGTMVHSVGGFLVDRGSVAPPRSPRRK
jgi:DNA-binding LacI/PurR family transcriptional regulator